jgi:hypothetical protein
MNPRRLMLTVALGLLAALVSMAAYAATVRAPDGLILESGCLTRAP